MAPAGIQDSARKARVASRRVSIERSSGRRRLSMRQLYAELRPEELIAQTSLTRRLPLFALLPLEEGLFDLLVNAQQPRFGASGTITEIGGFGLEFSGTFLSGTQLKRKLVREVHGARAVFLRHVGGFLQHCHDRAPRVIRHHVCVRLPPRGRRKLDYGFLLSVVTHD